MRFDILPDNPIVKSEINNFNYFKPKIDKLTITKKYLNSTLRYWIENTPNPLSIPWIQNLVTDDLNWLEDRLNTLETTIGNQVVESIHAELEEENANNPTAIIRKINSLAGEINALIDLTKLGFRNLNKVNRYGDWINEDSIISVKTKFNLDSNYLILENVIRGQMFIAENVILRQYSQVRIRNEVKYNDSINSRVIKLLDSALPALLKRADKGIDEGRLIYDKVECSDLISTKLNVEVHRYNAMSRDKKIEIKIAYQDSSITLEFIKQDKIKQFSNFTADSDGFHPVGIRQELTELNLDSIIEKLDSAFLADKTKRTFVGWINIEVHSKFEKYITENQLEVHKELRLLIGTKPYRVFVCFIPHYGFDLAGRLVMDVAA